MTRNEITPQRGGWFSGRGVFPACSVFARPELDTETAIDLVEYHLERNRVAHESHRKSWLRTHKRIKPKVLL